jgi:hypothetical protein
LYSKNRTFVLFFCKNKAQDNILSHALLCYAMLCLLFYTVYFIPYCSQSHPPVHPALPSGLHALQT